MAHRKILTERQRAALFGLPTDEPTLLKHYVLNDFDLEQIAKRRRPENKLGFAVQLCALRYPGRLIAPGEFVPPQMLKFIGAQLRIAEDALAEYAARRQTRQQHLQALRSLYGFKNFAGRGVSAIKSWLVNAALTTSSNEQLVKALVDHFRAHFIILPSTFKIERLCADALVEAERLIDQRIAARVGDDLRTRFDTLLDDMVGDQLSRFVWLRQFEVGNNSRDANRLLDRLELLQSIDLPLSILEGIPQHRINRLRRHGERYFINDLRRLDEHKRIPIIAVCVSEWRMAIADTLVETHDRIVGKTYREAKRIADSRINDAKSSLQSTLKAFKGLGAALIDAHHDDASLEVAVVQSAGWPELEKLVATASKLTDTMAADPLAHVTNGFNRFRRYAPRLLRALDIEATTVCEPLMDAIKVIRSGNRDTPRLRKFLRPTSKWHRHLRDGDTKAWEVAVLFHVREAFRSRDIWLKHSRQFADFKQTLVPASSVATMPGLAIPLNADAWLADRQQQMQQALVDLDKAIRSGGLPYAVIEDGELKTERLKANTPAGADALVLDLYDRLPEVRITDILAEADNDIGFTDAFSSIRNGSPCKDKLGLLNVLLAEGLNLGLSKMAEASNTHDYWPLNRIKSWFMETEHINRALAMVVEAQRVLPMAAVWGVGESASSDGQFFPTTRQGEAMNLINAKYGNKPGIKAYTHVSDQFTPFATQDIPATVSEAPYILDGLLLTDAGQRIKEQYADTGGFTDYLFAVMGLLKFQFIPRIRDLPSKRLYLFEPSKAPNSVRGLIGGKVRVDLIKNNWPGVLQITATMINGSIAPSQLLRTLSSYPRQHELAVTLREIGRIERTLFIIRWLLDGDLQRRAQLGLNKGEAHHALKNALRIGRQGEIRDRSRENQRYRIAGLNLLAAIVIYWNTKHLGLAVEKRRKAGLEVDPALLKHVSPLGWAHILLTGEYRWAKKRLQNP